MDCPFCQLVDEVVLIENDLCIAIQTRDPVLLGSAMLFPRAHRATPFDITADEWAATRELLLALRDQIDRDHRPDGYNIGWNVGAVGGQEVEHAHLHLIPRFADEPLAGRGIRHAFKQPSNARPRM